MQALPLTLVTFEKDDPLIGDACQNSDVSVGLIRLSDSPSVPVLLHSGCRV